MHCVERYKYGTEYCTLRQKSTTVTCHAALCETVDLVTGLVSKYSKSVDSVQHGLRAKEVRYVEDDGDKLLNKPTWTLDELWPSVSDSLRLSVRSAFYDIRTAFAARGISIPTYICGVPLFTHQYVQVIADSPSSEAAHVISLSHKGDALECVSVVEAGKGDASWRATEVKSSLAVKNL